MSVAGLLLAAGAGRRRGGPKALAHDPDGTSWLRRGLAVLRDGGCAEVTVVLGAGAEEARAVLGADPADVVVAEDWDEGMGASLRTGLTALGARAVDAPAADAALVLLVDLPDVGADVVARLVAAVDGPGALARAAYDGEPGHPVVLGRDHWAGVVATARGDRGARDYLRAHPPVLVECGDLATGADVDGPV
ncbi:nucleotidyltransferase family protein [Nocardioides taihuensis]|uniref:NTP transferase domain-containing protein n=1 Tax=Nocardioides taihuensis TaxID=1835606 RepID=A0ABW0BFP6_9ACTN